MCFTMLGFHRRRALVELSIRLKFFFGGLKACKVFGLEAIGLEVLCKFQHC